MKKIKIITSLLLFITIFVSISITSASAVTSYDNFELEYNSTSKSYTVVNYVGNDKNVKIPEMVYGRFVTKIGSYAFADNTTIETVEVPYLVSCFDEYSFSGCTSLKEINIPEVVSNINQFAFFNCKSLKNITMDCRIKTVNESVFQNCSSLESIKLPSTVETIGTYAFANCKSLGSVSIGDNVSSISSDAFNGCSSTLKIVANIGSYAEKFARDNNIAFEESPQLIGDVNNDGVINVRDSVYIMRYTVLQTGYEIPENTPIFKRADVNGDGKVNVVDAKLIQKYAMHMIEEF